MWRSIEEYHRPGSLEQALALQSQSSGARFVAGGTDLFVRIHGGTERPRVVVSLRGVPELSGIELSGAGARIGAAVTIAELLEHEGIRERYPVLVQAAGCLGSPQIRNAATVGGNLCNASPCADTAPPLLVLEARVRLLSARGSRELALESFFRGPGQSALAPGEVLGAVLLEPPRRGSRGLFFKKRRVQMDLAQASVALLAELDGDRCLRLRVAAGSVAPTPARLREVEALLEGKDLTDALLLEAQSLARSTVAPITDLRASEEYRREITGVFVRRGLEQLWRTGAER
jgi:carbon-monoxide dehydrogenase medium subunit